MDEIKEDTVTKRVTFPIAVWVDFEVYAKRHYGDCYWLAIKDTMEKAKLFETVGLLKIEIDNIYNEILKLQESKSDKTEVEKKDLTLGKDPIVG